MKKRSGWTSFGIVVSVIYAGALFWLARMETPGGWFEPAFGMELNAFGDFLAGAFAPLAFLWLFVAVMIQSNELELQRKELSQTRETMIAQVEESRRQAAYIGTQTDILVNQFEQQKRLGADDQFNKLLDQLENLLQSPSANSGGGFRRLEKPGEWARQDFNFVPARKGEDRDHALTMLCEDFIANAPVARNLGGEFCLSQRGRRWLEDMREVLGATLAMQGTVSAGLSAFARSLRLNKMLETVALYWAYPDMV